jgi:hypothetical protein
VNVPSWTGGKSAGDFASLWGTIELILLSYFILEYITRVFVARDVKKFCREHIWLLIFTTIMVLEFVVVIAYRTGLRYDPWGFGPLDLLWDTHRLRPLRVIVPLRFCAFSSDFRGIKVAALTVEKVAGRMMTPSLFFIVFMVLFGGMMYVFELLQCKAMEVPDGSGNLKWYYMNQNGEDDCTVQDMFDAIWIIIVTMTSVGYGQRFPKSPQGKGVAILAAIFGAFYMAMPLTIIGSTFYEIYVEQEESRQRKKLRTRLRSAAFRLAKKTSFFKRGNQPIVILSGYDTLSTSLCMLPEHAKIIDGYCAISRSDVHQMVTLDSILEFKAKHTKTMELLSLYLHEENHDEVARQHLHLAKSISGGDHSAALSAFNHVSKHFGANDIEQRILDDSEENI